MEQLDAERQVNRNTAANPTHLVAQRDQPPRGSLLINFYYDENS